MSPIQSVELTEGRLTLSTFSRTEIRVMGPKGPRQIDYKRVLAAEEQRVGGDLGTTLAIALLRTRALEVSLQATPELQDEEGLRTIVREACTAILAELDLPAITSALSRKYAGQWMVEARANVHYLRPPELDPAWLGRLASLYTVLNAKAILPALGYEPSVLYDFSGNPDAYSLAMWDKMTWAKDVMVRPTHRSSDEVTASLANALKIPTVKSDRPDLPEIMLRAGYSVIPGESRILFADGLRLTDGQRSWPIEDIVIPTGDGNAVGKALLAEDKVDPLIIVPRRFNGWEKALDAHDGALLAAICALAAQGDIPVSTERPLNSDLQSYRRSLRNRVLMHLVDAEIPADERGAATEMVTLAYEAMAKQDSGRAGKLIREALDLDPNNARAYYLAGTIDPSNPSNANYLAEAVDIERARLRDVLLEAANGHFAEVRGQLENLATYMHAYASQLYQSGDLESAAETGKYYFALDPEDSRIFRYTYAAVLLESGQYTACEDFCDGWIEGSPTGVSKEEVLSRILTGQVDAPELVLEYARVFARTLRDWDGPDGESHHEIDRLQELFDVAPRRGLQILGARPTRERDDPWGTTSLHRLLRETPDLAEWAREKLDALIEILYEDLTAYRSRMDRSRGRRQG